MNKIALFSTAIALMVLVVPLVSACGPPPPCGPTSLEVWKEIECVSVCGCEVTICGWIYIQNDPWYSAHILHVIDYVEAKWRGNEWNTLATETLVEPTLIIDSGATEGIWFCITFQKGMYKAYRNVVEVHLENHPTGDRWFQYRLSFEDRL